MPNIKYCFRCMNKIENNTLICPLCKNSITNNVSSSDVLRPGTVLKERYILGNPIARSEQSITYISLDKHLSSKVAVKEFFPSLVASRIRQSDVSVSLNDNYEFDRVKSEFICFFNKIARFRATPNVLKVYSAFNENNTTYIIHELPYGTSLKQHLSNNYGELKWTECSKMFLNFIKFLQHFHNNELLHLGLCPEALCVENENLKIIDFSNSFLRKNGYLIEPNLFDGYSAPEQYYEERCLGPYTDVYGIASVIYKSLTGTRPVNSNSRKINDNLLPPNVLDPTIPKNISVAIMSALVLSPKIRTQTMSDLFADLSAPERSNLEERKSSVPKVEFRNKSSKGIKTHNLIFITMIVSCSVVLFSLAILVVFLFSDHFFG